MKSVVLEGELLLEFIISRNCRCCLRELNRELKNVTKNGQLKFHSLCSSVNTQGHLPCGWYHKGNCGQILENDILFFHCSHFCGWCIPRQSPDPLCGKHPHHKTQPLSIFTSWTPECAAESSPSCVHVWWCLSPWVFFWHWSYLQLAETYGNICTLWMGHRPVMVLYGFQALKNGLTNNSEDVSGRLQTYVFNEMSNGKGKVFMSVEGLHPWLSLFPLMFSLLKNPLFLADFFCVLKVNHIILKHHPKWSPNPTGPHVFQNLIRAARSCLSILSVVCMSWFEIILSLQPPLQAETKVNLYAPSCLFTAKAAVRKAHTELWSALLPKYKVTERPVEL